MDRNSIQGLLEEAEAGLQIFLQTKHYGKIKIGNPKTFLKEQLAAGKAELIGHIELAKDFLQYSYYAIKIYENSILYRNQSMAISGYSRH